MSDMERRRIEWSDVREALLDFAWRDVYTRWYLILTPAWWIALWTVVPRLVNVDVGQSGWWMLVVLPLGWFGQRTIGKVCDILESWFESESKCDCPVCQEQRTGGAT